jgi:hypothetical protein
VARFCRWFGLFLLTACAYRTRTRTLDPADLADPQRTTVTNFLSAPIRPGQPSESTPSEVPRAALLDEARVVRFSPAGICVGLVTRTSAVLDLPLSECNFEINERPAQVGPETIRMIHHDAVGTRQVVSAEVVTGTELARLRITSTSSGRYDVVERSATVCAPAPASRPERLTVEVVLPQDDHRGNWGEVFEWELTGSGS